MHQVSIIHFQPIEQYPPIQNLLTLLNKIEDIHFNIITTSSNYPIFPQLNSNIYIHYIDPQPSSRRSWVRIWSYIKFNLIALYKLFKYKPKTILYYESYSALPAILYKYIFRRTKLMLHYHEYHDLDWYFNGMKTVKFYNYLEKRIAYKKAIWISHTNDARLNMFLTENHIAFNAQKHFTVPNYPLSSWAAKLSKSNHNFIEFPLKIVYVGSFSSFDTLYIKEVTEWVKRQRGNVKLDIYYHSTTEIVLNYIKNQNQTNIRLLGHLDYSQLPYILNQYQVGLILYKGAHPNFIYNAPNKLFEYLACGLDVWYPEEMIGCHTYDNAIEWPKVLRLNFNVLNDYLLEDLMKRVNKNSRKIDYTYESVTKELITNLIS